MTRWRQLNREGYKVGRDRVARLMDELDLSGVVRGNKQRTTRPAEVSQRQAGLVRLLCTLLLYLTCLAGVSRGSRHGRG